MRLKKFTDNALRSLIYLALYPENRITISDISEYCGVSRNHLVKVIHFLAKQGFVKTTAGRNGGIKLKTTADNISVGDVVRVVEGHQPVINCLEPLCPIAPVCHLRNIFDEAKEAFLSTLDNRTIADLIKNEEALRIRLGQNK